MGKASSFGKGGGFYWSSFQGKLAPPMLLFGFLLREDELLILPAYPEPMLFTGLCFASRVDYSTWKAETETPLSSLALPVTMWEQTLSGLSTQGIQVTFFPPFSSPTFTFNHQPSIFYLPSNQQSHFSFSEPPGTPGIAGPKICMKGENGQLFFGIKSKLIWGYAQIPYQRDPVLRHWVLF